MHCICILGTSFPPIPLSSLVIKISENDINDELAVGVQYQHERYLAMMRENFLDGLPIFRGC